MKPATPTGQRAILTAYARFRKGGKAFLCPMRIGKNFGPAIETAVLKKLAVQGYSDGQPTPQLTAAGLAHAAALLRELVEG